MADQNVNLESVGLPTDPPLDNLRALGSARRLHVHQMLSAQDRPVAAGRRTIGYYSWGGEYDHTYGHSYMVDGDTAGVAFADPRSPYPSATTELTLLELEGVPVTPGCSLMVHATYMLAGATFSLDGVDSGAEQTYTSTGAQGQIVAAITWDDGSTTETVTTTIDCQAAGAEPYAIDDGEGSAWHAMREGSARNEPADLSYVKSAPAQWSTAGVTVDVELKILGCARPVDIVIYEVPRIYGLTDGDPAGPAHVYAESGLPRTQFPHEYPVEGASSGDARYGARHAIAVAAAQEGQLGPACWCYSSQRGRHIGRGWATSSDPDPTTITGTTETVLGGSSTITTESPRIELGTLAYGRNFEQSDTQDIMSENGACR
ncbi:MAG: hypothetical protein ACPGXI_17485, partial [Mycobacterium sp.]